MCSVWAARRSARRCWAWACSRSVSLRARIAFCRDGSHVVSGFVTLGCGLVQLLQHVIAGPGHLLPSLLDRCDLGLSLFQTGLRSLGHRGGLCGRGVGVAPRDPSPPAAQRVS